MKKSAVFFDIDGTIWDEKQRIPESTIKAVHQLQANGHLAFLCSGRSRSTIRAQHLVDVGFDGILAGCGTYVEYRGEVVFNEIMSPEKVKDVMTRMKATGIGAFYEGTEKLYIDWSYFAGEEYSESFRESLGEDCCDITAIDENSKINKMSVSYRESSKEQLLETFSDFEIVVHDFKDKDREDSKYIAEIMPKGFTKATGIAWVCEKLGIDHENTYAFGDSANDLDMLRYVHCGVAMGNGTNSCKEAADIVTTNLEDDGIKNGLEKLGLI